MQGSQLPNADLSGAILTQAQFNCASKRHTDLAETESASKTNKQCADLSSTNLQNAILKETELQEANFTGANLTSANLSQANLSNANLTGADFSRAILFKTDMRETNLTTSQLLGKISPKLCETKLPTNISTDIDTNRDCGLMNDLMQTNP